MFSPRFRLSGTTARLVIIAFVVCASCAVVALRPRFPQPLSYHNFADQRTLLGVPNFMNVITNTPFLLVGIWGLFIVLKVGTFKAENVLSWMERLPYVVLFIGVALIFVGSSYYHLSPNNPRLVWDRLPMAVGFMGLLSATIGERVNGRLGLLMLPALVATGVVSVFYWHFTEQIGSGDLRFYLLVQFGSLVLVLLLLGLLQPRYTHGVYLLGAIVLYAAAKILESVDADVFAATGGLLSGHSCKHLVAALGISWIVQMLRRRKPLVHSPTGEIRSSAATA